MRSNQAMIRDQPGPDRIAIKSKSGRDHEELKILLKNCLIASRFNKELREEERIHRFLKKNSREKCGQFDPGKAD